MIKRVVLAILAGFAAVLFTVLLAGAQQAPAAGSTPAATPTLSAAQAVRAKELGKRVKCMCGGCNDAAGGCYHSGGTFSGPCATALAMLKKIDTEVADGESDDAILKSFVQEYGPTVLIEPPKSGFNLAAWIMPVLVPLIALFAVWEAARKWRHRGAAPPVAAPEAGPVSADLLERVQRETGRD
jgi:cytochrome c-type biogenesis protein CcmH